MSFPVVVSRVPRRLRRAACALLLLAGLPTLLLTDVASAQGTPLRRGQSAAGTLANGDTLRYILGAGDDYWVFGEVAQRTVDVVVRLVDPRGDQLGRVDGSERGGERFAGRLRAGGRYTVEVTASGEAHGDFTITLHRLEPVETDPKKRTAQLMARYDGDDSPGAAVQVWRDGRTIYSNAWGMANLAYRIPFEPDTRTNIGSTSKQFTAFAIMLQADRGLLSLDDDIRKHIPELPAFDHTITVRHLITHTSGLREFLNLLVMSGRRIDHGDWIDRSELIDIVRRQPALQNIPGAEWNYNNTAFGLAALIVERTSGQDFPTYMRENVFGPLGMSRTLVRASPEQMVPERSEGYAPGGDGFLETGDLGGAVGAGAVYSTVQDLQTWVENFRTPRVGSARIVEEMMTSHVLNDGEESGYGYGLMLDEQRGLRRVHHGGADVAHRSMLVYYPEIRAGITVQSNHAGFNSAVAFELAEAFFGDAMEPEDRSASGVEAFDAASWDAQQFDDFVGRYSLDEAPSIVLTFTREDQTLFAQVTGQPRIEIRPASDSTFTFVGVEAVVTFHRDSGDVVTGATLDQNGSHPATRLDEADVSTGWEPVADALGAYVGRYFSEELETFYTLSLVDGVLRLAHRRLDAADLTPGDAVDRFTGADLRFDFERDRNRRVIGFYLSNGRTRDVRFERVR
jgi:CubicO group peptidase (beta-lactamase class C family)